VEAHHDDAAELSSFAADLRALGTGRMHEVVDGPGTFRAILGCACRVRPSTEERIEKHGGVPIRPIVYRDGWEHYRAFTVEDAAATAILEDLRTTGEVRMESKRRGSRSLWQNHFVLSVDEFLEPLTRRQILALKDALQAGYYAVPRRVKTETIARARNVPRTTFEEHLRKAESKVLNHLRPYVELVAGGAAAEQGAPSKRHGGRSAR